MESYLMMLYVTLEQETALKSFFGKKGWEFCKPDLSVTTDRVGPLKPDGTEIQISQSTPKPALVQKSVPVPLESTPNITPSKRPVRAVSKRRYGGIPINTAPFVKCAKLSPSVNKSPVKSSSKQPDTIISTEVAPDVMEEVHVHVAEDGTCSETVVRKSELDDSDLYIAGMDETGDFIDDGDNDDDFVDSEFGEATFNTSNADDTSEGEGLDDSQGGAMSQEAGPSGEGGTKARNNVGRVISHMENSALKPFLFEGAIIQFVDENNVPLMEKTLLQLAEETGFVQNEGSTPLFSEPGIGAQNLKMKQELVPGQMNLKQKQTSEKAVKIVRQTRKSNEKKGRESVSVMASVSRTGCATANESVVNITMAKPKQSSTKVDGDSGQHPKFYCDVCGLCYKTQGGLKGHKMTHGDKIYCKQCLKVFDTEEDLTEHSKKHVMNFNCQECGKCFKKRSRLKYHMVIHSNRQPTPCPFPDCEKKYLREDKLRDHINAHNGIFPYKCELCPKVFHSQSTYCQHRNICRNRNVFKCKTCNEIYYSRFDLNDHLTSTHGYEFHACEDCGLRFSYKYGLQKHKNSKCKGPPPVVVKME